MSDIKDLKAALKATFSGVADMAKDIAAGAGDKAKALGRMAKLSMDITTEKDNLKKVYAEIGKLYYANNMDEPGEFFIQLFDEAKLANDHLSCMEDELAALKADAGECGDADFEDVVEAAEKDACCCGDDDSCCCGEDSDCKCGEGDSCQCDIEVEITAEDAPKDEDPTAE